MSPASAQQNDRPRQSLFVAFTLLGVLLLLSHSATATDDVVPISAQIPVIHLAGVTRLDPQVIARIAKLYREPDASAEEIRIRLLDTNLFSSVYVTRSQRVVNIRVREKVTWFAVPYVSADNSGTYYSVAAGKAVLAHEDVFTYAWYQVGTNDHEASAAMEGRNILGSAWDSAFTFGYQDALKWTYTGREITQRTQANFYGGNLSVAYRFGLPWKVALENYVENHNFQALDGSYFSGFQWSHRMSLEYDEFYTIRGLGEGRSLRMSFEASDPLSVFRFYKVGAEAHYSLIHHGNFAWITRPSVYYSPSLPFYQLFELGGQSLRGFASQQFRDRSYVLDQNDLFIHSWTLWKLEPRLLLFTDWAFIQGSGRTAVGAGVQFGVRDLLLSAIQILAGYGFNPNGIALTFSLGQKF